MTNRGGNDDNAADGSLAHNAGWSDVWAGLLLTLILLGSAILVAILFSGRPSSPLTGDKPAAARPKSLYGVRDPSRPGWRTDRPWDLMGTHKMAPDAEQGGRGAVTEDPTIETARADVGQARPR
jgi:hypothetical protein